VNAAGAEHEHTEGDGCADGERVAGRLPADRVRMHVCWGNYEAPHHLDVSLDEFPLRLYAATSVR
jgi:hypothetical protein